MVSGYHLFPVAPAAWVNAMPARAVTSVNRMVGAAIASDVSAGAGGSDCPTTGGCAGTRLWERSQNSPSPTLAPRHRTRRTHRPRRWECACWRRITLSPQKNLLRVARVPYVTRDVKSWRSHRRNLQRLRECLAHGTTVHQQVRPVRASHAPAVGKLLVLYSALSRCVIRCRTGDVSRNGVQGRAGPTFRAGIHAVHGGEAARAVQEGDASGRCADMPCLWSH